MLNNVFRDFYSLKEVTLPIQTYDGRGGGGKLTPGWDPLTSEHVNDIVMLLF